MGIALPRTGGVELMAPVSLLSLLRKNLCEMKFLHKMEDPISSWQADGGGQNLEFKEF